jgi:hypothetical protein
MWLTESQEASNDVSHGQLGGHAQCGAGGRLVSKGRGFHWVAMPHMGLAVSQSVSRLPTGWLYPITGLAVS